MRRPRNTTEQLTGTSCVMKHGKSLLWLWSDGEDYSSSSSEITSISTHRGRTNLQRRILVAIHLSDGPVAFRFDDGLVGAAPRNGAHGIGGCKRIGLAQELGQFVSLAHADRNLQVVVLDVDGRWRDFFNYNCGGGYRRIVIMRWDLLRGKRYL